ncbi:ACT domain-containing protein, partial [Schizophyllum amplum]
MSPPSDHTCLHLQTFNVPFYTVKYDPADGMPAWVSERLCQKSDKFFSVTTTFEEISVAFEDFDGAPKNSKAEEWRVIKIAGPMEFDLVGVICSFTEALRTAKIGVYVVSTWNTDWVLIPAAKIEQAETALRVDGWQF